MAAKKKASKKKTSAKKSAKSKASKKPKKAAKKKASKKAKPASKKKAAKAKLGSKKTAPVKKAKLKKKAAKKAKPIDIPISRGPSIAPAVEVKPIRVEVVFKLGLGQATLKHFSAGKLVKTERITQTQAVSFPDAKQNDGISITGASAGSSDITTDRVTQPASDSLNPRHSEGPIAVSLLILE